MVRKTTRRHAQGDASRQLILDAALGLGAERGYVGTTLALIKERTGLPTSALYWHFDSKDDILSDALMHGFLQWDWRLKRWDSQHVAEDVARDGLAGAVLGCLRRSTDGMDNEPGFWRMGLLLALESGPAVGHGPRERFVKIRGEVLGDIQAWWSAAVPGGRQDAAELARITLAALDGLFLRQQSDGPAATDRLLVRLARGLATIATRSEPPIRPAPRPAAPASPAPSTPSTADETPTGRDKLLVAACTVAAESGYEGATISRICHAAGLPASSLYWHFADKDDLFAAVVEHSYAEWTATQPAWPPAAPRSSPLEDLYDMVLAVVDSIAGLPPFLRIGCMLLLLRRSRPTPGRERFVDVRLRRRRHTASWFRAAGAAEDEALLRAGLLMALDDGLLISRLVDLPTWRSAPTADLVTDLLAAGL